MSGKIAMLAYSNPYSELGFFGVLKMFMVRLWQGLQGELGAQDIASDEVQVLVLMGVAASAAMLGVLLVFRKMTMLANALSHTILIGIVAAFVWTQAQSFEGSFNGIINESALLLASFCMGILTTFLTELLAKGIGLQEDASTGVVFTSLFAVGVIAVTLLTRNAHIGIEAVMGNVDSLQASDLQMVVITLTVNILCLILFYRGFAITTFDAALARSFGFSPGFYSYFLMVLVSMTSITAFRAVGVLMVLAFFTGPPLSARLLAKDLHHTILIAIAYGIAAAILGVALSRHVLTVYGLPLSTGGVVVCVIVALYLATLLYCFGIRRGHNRLTFTEDAVTLGLQDKIT